MNATDTRQFATGAVRSKDADNTRFDLITPVGLDALADYYGRYIAPIGDPIDRLLGTALEATYRFLGGDGDIDDIALAAAAVAEVLAIEAGEERDWVISTPLVDNPEEDGYPYERIPFAAFKALAETCNEGAAKYGDCNWERGMPVHDLLNHAIRHVLLHLSGDRSEPHLAHALWNLLGAIHSFKVWPELNAGHLRGPGCTPPAVGQDEDAYADLRTEEQEPQDATGLSMEDAFLLLKRQHEHEMSFIDSDEWEYSSKESALADTLAGYYSGPLFGEDAETAIPKPKPHRIPAIAAYRATGQNAPVLYVSGPMSGIDDCNFPAFNRAADALRALGYPVLNPADFGADPSVSWSKCLERDLAMLSHANILVQLPGWEKSRGASLEFSTAVGLGKGVVDLYELV